MLLPFLPALSVLPALLALLPALPTVDAGPLQLRILRAPTPQLFYVVDQLSGWNAFSHKAYRRWCAAPENGGLSAADEALLAEHAGLRKRQGYGPLEAALNVDLPLEAALLAAVKSGGLVPADAEVERRVLEHFAPRVRALGEARKKALDDFALGLGASSGELRAFAEQASRFFGGVRVERTIVLVPTPPEGGGGGFNGGYLVVEVNGHVTAQTAPTEIVEHECWHAFAESKKDEIRAAAAEAGTDFETMSEGLAYAVSPGIYKPAAKPEALASAVAAHAAAHRSFFDDPYVRFNRLGLALRPTLEPMLRGRGVLADVLPIEQAIYRGLVELAAAEAPPSARYFWFGPADKALLTRISAGTHDIWSRPVQPHSFAELRPRMRAGDVVFLALTTLDEPPPELVQLLGPDAPVLAAKRKAAPSGELGLHGTHGEIVTAFWAADAAAVLALAARSPLLPH